MNSMQGKSRHKFRAHIIYLAILLTLSIIVVFKTIFGAEIYMVIATDAVSAAVCKIKLNKLTKQGVIVELYRNTWVDNDGGGLNALLAPLGTEFAVQYVRGDDSMFLIEHTGTDVGKTLELLSRPDFEVGAHGFLYNEAAARVLIGRCVVIRVK